MKVKIGSRGSRLALVQANWVKDSFLKKNKSLDVEIVIIKTTGDKDAHSSLSKLGGKGVFVKEIEEALLKKEIDVAVHSLKDLPQMLPTGLELGPFPRRESGKDVVISRFGELLRELPRASRIGTSSPRRSAIIKRTYKSRYRVEAIRGNVETRINKLHDGDYDAIVMAEAGIKRLGLESEITETLDVKEMLPAPGQGCLGLEYRSGEEEIQKCISSISDRDSDITARAERAFLQGVGGSCLVPLAGLAKIDKDKLIMKGMILDAEGTKCIEVEERGSIDNPELVGAQCAERLLHDGGSEILMSL